ncbi:hypothetical protein F4604DRAFT_1701741 [Suillus subluteus]|nr:hypothetical protein F4604DRAFT_1701741 [Suillus subluteus]
MLLIFFVFVCTLVNLAPDSIVKIETLKTGLSRLICTILVAFHHSRDSSGLTCLIFVSILVALPIGFTL